MNTFIKKYWGSSTAVLQRPRLFGWVDIALLVILAGVFYGLMQMAHEWSGRLTPVVEIDLSIHHLPEYTFFSMCRGLAAYVLSLIFTVAYGYWAAKDRNAERVLVPLLDILQSVPVLGFMPAFVLAMVALFPGSNFGLEMAAVLMIFTGQAWNMTFSFYHSVKAVQKDISEVTRAYGFSWFGRFLHLELPASAMGLVWNSMMSMAGGWFFLMINESFVLGDKDFRLPGVGSYMSVAVARGDVTAMVLAVAAMIAMIVILDQILWRPVVVWAQKFRIEETSSSENAGSWMLDLVRGSYLFSRFTDMTDRWKGKSARRRTTARKQHAAVHVMTGEKRVRLLRITSSALFAAVLIGMSFGLFKLIAAVSTIAAGQWLVIIGSAMLTLGRVLTATFIGTLWAVPAGLAIGLSPRLSRFFQPVVQIAASFPAPMLFPAVIWLLTLMNVGLDTGSILLMLLGTQWYILFNVMAGASAVPSDLREAVAGFRFTRIQRLRVLYLPAIFPYLVTGWVTAAGGAWNASIVSEYYHFRGQPLLAHGLGSIISTAAEHADFPVLTAGVLVMALVVVTFNRLVWRRMYRTAQDSYSLNK
jgi:NitT/TauT family transport system permease protein